VTPAKKKPTKRKPPPAPVGAARFIESMECLGVTQLPEGPAWTYEVKLDGYRLEAVKASRDCQKFCVSSRVD
jgi:ATP-dependent DNA ligase